MNEDQPFLSLIYGGKNVFNIPNDDTNVGVSPALAPCPLPSSCPPPLCLPHHHPPSPVPVTRDHHAVPDMCMWPSSPARNLNIQTE